MQGMRMTCGWKRAAVVAGAAALVGATGVAAQELVESDCRCVDEVGERIERCVCVVMPDLPARRPRLGVSIQPQQPERYDTQGARVYGVSPEGPAAEAGIEGGDILVRVGNQSLLEPLPPEDEEDLDPGRSLPVQRFLVLLAEAEERVELEYLRDGAPRMAEVELEGTGPLFLGGPGPFDFSAPAIERLGGAARP